LFDLPVSPENNALRTALCSVLIRAAINTDELKTAFDEAAAITFVKERDKVWLDAIKEGKRFKTGKWTKDIERVTDLMYMDQVFKDYAGKELDQSAINF
jgi:hypothetical protein